MQRKFLLSVFVCLGVAGASPASGQGIHDHLQCFKVREKASSTATVDLKARAVALADETGCRVRIRARELCIPATATVTEISEPLPADDVVGLSLAEDYLCYKVQCDSAGELPDPIVVSDRFGARHVRRPKAQTLCVPARKDCGDTNAPTCGGFCTGGLTCTDQGGACQCS